MVNFCPTCEKILRKKKAADGSFILKCIGCGYEGPYVKAGKKKTISKALEKKILDNKTRVVGEEPDIDLKPRTEVECPECGHFEAFYEQFQTRSADEPATTFYSCTKCKHRWREY